LISAVDTNVLLDLLTPHAARGQESEDALAKALEKGALIISEPVYVELAAGIGERHQLDSFLADTSITLDPSTSETLQRAGRAWNEYLRHRPAALECGQCGASQRIQCQRCNATIRPRQHVAADFIIGAHALLQADRLLTRDEGYYATYFPELKLA